VTRLASSDGVVARRLAIAAWALTIIVTAAALAIRVVSGAPALPNRFALGDAATTAIGLLQVATATVAALILVRLPGQRVGWLLMATGVFYALSILAAAIAFATFPDGPAGLAIARWGGWFAWVTSTISGVTLVTIPFVFPDGRMRSPFIGRLLLLFAVPSLVVALAMTLQPGPMFLLTSLDNPLGIGPDVAGALPATALGGIAAYIGAPMVLAAASLASRFRGSRGVERQQLKWFVAASIVMMSALLITGWLGFVVNDGVRDERPLVAFALAATSVPIAIGIAILRYRLYAIDRIISRTISYGVLTAALVAVFAIVVVGLQALLARFTRGDAVPVAASTLVVFALFQPLRRRVQSTIDRRFYRARYDGEQAQAVLAARLRNNVDLESLAAEVRTVVDATIAPTSVGLWLRNDRARPES
jgi:hypothetical protein